MSNYWKPMHKAPKNEQVLLYLISPNSDDFDVVVGKVSHTGDEGWYDDVYGYYPVAWDYLVKPVKLIRDFKGT